MESTPFGPNVGATITGLQLQEEERPKIPEITPPAPAVLEPAPAKPIVDELRFCAIYMIGITPGMTGRVIPPERSKKGEDVGWVNPRGWLVVGPSNQVQDASYKEFLNSLQGYRWWLNAGKLYHTKERKIVWQNPSIVEDYIEECTCSKCSWKDTKTYQETCVMAEAKQFCCPSCGSRVLTRRSFTSVFPGKPNQREIFKTPEDDVLQQMHIRMCEEDIVPSELLPRIWALYPIGDTPFDWAPQDEKAKALDQKFKAFGKTIRPFKTARTVNFSKGAHHRIYRWAMEVHSELQFGWVKVTDLCTQSIDGPTGYTRRFGFEPKLTGV